MGIEFYVQRKICKIERGRKKLIEVIFLSIFFSFDVRWSDVNAEMYWVVQKVTLQKLRRVHRIATILRDEAGHLVECPGPLADASTS